MLVSTLEASGLESWNTFDDLWATLGHGAQIFWLRLPGFLVDDKQVHCPSNLRPRAWSGYGTFGVGVELFCGALFELLNYLFRTRRRRQARAYLTAQLFQSEGRASTGVAVAVSKSGNTDTYLFADLSLSLSLSHIYLSLLLSFPPAC